MGRLRRSGGVRAGHRSAEPVLASGRVTSVLDGRFGVEVGGEERVLARAAAALGCEPCTGDTVLLARTERGAWWVTSVLERAEGAAGPGAQVRGVGEARVVSVTDGSGRLVFEHSEGRSVLHAPRGHLELRADEGALRLSARDGVQVESAAEVRVASGTRVRVRAPASTLSLDAHGTTLETPQLAATARRATLTSDEAQLAARLVSTTCQVARQTVDVLEVRAGRILERAENVFREATQLAQVRAARVRILASEAFHAFGRRALVKGQDDLKLKADKIHLG